MANANTKRRQKQIRKEPIVTQGFKKKKKNFPAPNGDDIMTMANQRKLFYGI